MKLFFWGSFIVAAAFAVLLGLPNNAFAQSVTLEAKLSSGGTITSGTTVSNSTIVIFTATGNGVAIGMKLSIWEDSVLVKECAAAQTTCTHSTSNSNVTKNFEGRLRSFGGGLTYDTSNSISVTWAAPSLPAPTLLSPGNGATYTDKDLISFTWGNTGASWYGLEIRNPSGNPVRQVNVSGTSYTLTSPLTTAGTYTWRVASCQAGSSSANCISPAWTSERSFSVTTNPVISVSLSSPTQFPDTLVGEQSGIVGIVSNTGTGILTGSITGLASPFSCISGCLYNVSAGNSSSFALRFSPTSTGPFSGAAIFSGGGGKSIIVEGVGTKGGVTADFEADKTSGIPPLTVTFTDKSTTSAPITRWQWDFDGDGSNDVDTTDPSRGKNPSFTYFNVGNFTVTLRITTSLGDSVSKQKIGYVSVLGPTNVVIDEEEPLDFGTVKYELTKTQTLTLRNTTASEAKNITNISFISGDKESFSLAPGTPTSFLLLAGKTRNIPILFSPLGGADGTRFATKLRIEILGEPTITYDLVGTGSTTGGGGGGDTGDEDTGVGGIVRFENPLGDKTFEGLIRGIIKFILTLSMILLPVIIVIGGLMFMTAGGDPGRIGTGKKMITWGVIGFTIVLFSRALIEVLENILGVE